MNTFKSHYVEFHDLVAFTKWNCYFIFIKIYYTEKVMIDTS